MTRQQKQRKKNQGSKWIRPEKRRAIYLRDGLRCAYCGRGIEDHDVLLTLDHLVAVEMGGTNHESNLITCCRSCNSSKGAKTIRSFFKHLRENYGTDTKKIGPRIRRLAKRNLKKYREMEKELRK